MKNLLNRFALWVYNKTSALVREETRYTVRKSCYLEKLLHQYAEKLYYKTQEKRQIEWPVYHTDYRKWLGNKEHNGEINEKSN